MVGHNEGPFEVINARKINLAVTDSSRPILEITGNNAGTDGNANNRAVFAIVNSGAGNVARFRRSAVGASNEPVIETIEDNASSAQTVINIQNDGTGFGMNITQNGLSEGLAIDMNTLDKGFIDFIATADADATSAISTLNTTGTVTDHIQIGLNGASKWLSVSDDPS